MTPEPGQIIGDKYRILRLIGDGGMGTVYEAEHIVLGSRVALKFLHPEIAQQPNLRQRFLQEARVSATVQNQHIVRVTDVDTAGEGAYLVMELLRGEPLANLIAREGTLDAERAVQFALQICAGLEAAHDLGIVHRDLKPDNVFVTPGPSGPLLKLLDFGIAKLRHTHEYQMTLTRPGAIMGTPEYMAPEQAFGADAVDQRSDIYSLGIILFEMLSGRVPVPGENPQEIAEKILRGNVLRLNQAKPGLPPQLVTTIERATAGNPDQRFNDVAELRAALLPFAPSFDRVSVVGSRGAAHGSQTGAATPFIPVNVTPFTGALGGPRSKDANLERVSNVPKTLPPDDVGPPVASQLGTLPKVRTQSMPETADPSALPRVAVAVTSSPAKRSAKRSAKSGSGGLLLTVTGALLVVAALSSWYYYDKYVATYPPAPPRPVLKSPEPTTTVSEVPTDFDTEPDPAARQQPSDPRTPRTPGRTPELPTLTLPTELPPFPSTLPTGFPTTLPTTFPVPGFPAPGGSVPAREDNPEE